MDADGELPKVAIEPAHDRLDDVLANTIRRLEDRDLDRLLSAVLAEQKRRGKRRSAWSDSSCRQSGRLGSPIPGQQLIKSVDGVIVDTGQHIGEPSLRIDVHS